MSERAHDRKNNACPLNDSEAMMHPATRGMPCTCPPLDPLKPKPCPFCGAAPTLLPEDPAKDGSAWGAVACDNESCPARPIVHDDGRDADYRGSDAYKAAAVKRWNTRA